jgi:hypothetical protein
MTSPRPAFSLFLLCCAAPLALLVAARVAWPASAVDAAASAASAAQASEERAQIAKERAAVEARFVSRERECRQRFIVTSCLDEAKAEQRQALDRLRARQLVIDEARRHERSEERKAELADKAAEDARRESARAAHAAASAASDAALPGRAPPFELQRPEGAPAAASGPHQRARSSGTGIGIKPQAQESQALRAQREATSRAAFEARKAEAAEHREEAIERTTKRMAQKSPASPLPVPRAASGAPSAAAQSASRP